MKRVFKYMSVIMAALVMLSGMAAVYAQETEYEQEMELTQEYPYDLVSVEMEPVQEPEYVSQPEIAEEYNMQEEPVVQETPVVQEVPAVEETPVVQEAPAVEEPPVVQEALAVEETPVVQEAPAVEETPVVQEAPAVEETPVIQEAPVVQEEPSVQAESQVNIQETQFENNETIPEATDLINNPTENVPQENSSEETVQETATAADQTEKPEESEKQITELSFVPLDVIVRLKEENLKNNEYYSEELEIRNVSNKTMNNIEITLWSRDDRISVTYFRDLNEKTASENDVNYKHEGPETSFDERVLRIRELTPGTSVKTAIILKSCSDFQIGLENIEAGVKCDFSSEGNLYTSHGEWDITLDPSVWIYNQKRKAEEQSEISSQEENETESEVISTEVIPTEEEITEASTDQVQPEEETQPVQPEEETQPVQPEETASEDLAQEQTITEEITSEEPVQAAEQEEVQTELSPVQEDEIQEYLPAEIVVQDMPVVGENAVMEDVTFNIQPQTNDDEIISFQVISDGETETQEPETDELYEDFYYDDGSYYYDDWGYYGGVSDTSQINTATPYLLVQSYSHKRTVNSGEPFGVDVTLLNTSKKLGMENVIIKVETSESLSLANGTNTLFVNGVEAGGTTTQRLNLLAASECKNPVQNITLTISFDYIDNKERKQGTATESITIPVEQQSRLELRDPVYDQMEAGKEGVISIPYVNKGISSLYNMEASLTLENADAVQKVLYAGNVDSGKSGTLDFVVTPFEEGDYSGEVTLKYEDSSKKEVAVAIPLKFTSTMAYVADDFSDMSQEYEMQEPEPSSSFPVGLVAGIGAGIIVLAAVIILIVRRKKKNNKSSDELLDDWFKSSDEK